jgi:hypothetical protein
MSKFLQYYIYSLQPPPVLLVSGLDGQHLHNSITGQKYKNKFHLKIIISFLKEKTNTMNEEVSVSDDNSSKHNNSVSNDSSSYAPSGTNSSTTGTSNKEASNRGGIPEQIIASRENRNVKYSRIIVHTVLLLSATIAGVMTWYWTKEAEQDDFETQVSNSIFVESCAF